MHISANQTNYFSIEKYLTSGTRAYIINSSRNAASKIIMNAIEEPVIYSCQGFGQIDRAANSPPPPLVERCVVVARSEKFLGSIICIIDYYVYFRQQDGYGY